MQTNKIDQKILQLVIMGNVEDALKEDLNNTDKTSALLSKKISGKAIIKSNQNAILCGIPWVNNCFKSINKDIYIIWNFNEGDLIKKNQEICSIKGNYNALLTGERVALNFLQTLSGTATSSYKHNQLIKKYSTKLFDTRKTIPGLRMAQKYAVTIGGGHNQRLGLFDAVLIKENHIKALGSIDKALKVAKKNYSLDDIQIEVENLKEFKIALSNGAKNILLDNFSIKNIEKVIKINQGVATLEASGNINYKTIARYAKTGIDRISVGSITKNVEAIDFSMIIEVQKANFT